MTDIRSGRVARGGVGAGCAIGLTSAGAIERQREMHILFAGVLRGVPALFARDRFQPMQEARGHRGRAAGLGGMAEDHVLIAEQLREVMRRQADAPLRQIEAELVPHRPAQPGIGARRRRPHAFDQAAGDDAVGLHQPRFQRAVDVQRRAGLFRPPHRAVGERGLEHFRVVRQRDREPARLLLGDEVVEGG